MFLESIMPEFIKYLVDNSCIASSQASQAMSEKTIFVAENKIAVKAVLAVPEVFFRLCPELFDCRPRAGPVCPSKPAPSLSQPRLFSPRA